MNIRFYVFLLFFAGLAFPACKKESFEYRSDYKESFAAWKSFKNSSGNSYRYVVVTSSWVGISSETTITVRSGKVTNRSFIRKMITQTPGVFTISEQWDENEATLNTHTSGAATRTLDEIYEQAKNDWLRKRPDAQTYFEAGNNGLISNCGYVPDGCADDCFVGITITQIEKL